jgi:hypothetical protein
VADKNDNAIFDAPTQELWNVITGGIIAAGNSSLY